MFRPLVILFLVIIGFIILGKIIGYYFNKIGQRKKEER